MLHIGFHHRNIPRRYPNDYPGRLMENVATDDADHGFKINHTLDHTMDIPFEKNTVWRELFSTQNLH